VDSRHGREATKGMSTATRLSLYPHSYPRAGGDPPKLAGAHRNNCTQSEPAGCLPRFRYAVPISPSPPDLTRIGPFVCLRGGAGALVGALVGPVSCPSCVSWMY
jgi:hypothetical protein